MVTSPLAAGCNVGNVPVIKRLLCKREDPAFRNE